MVQAAEPAAAALNMLATVADDVDERRAQSSNARADQHSLTAARHLVIDGHMKCRRQVSKEVSE